MKLEHLAGAFFLFATISLSANASLVISEVVYNEVGSDTTGEWIEIFNNGAVTLNLSNYKIGDEETKLGTGATEAMFQFPAGASIAPGAVQIIAVSATRFNAVYGFMPTYEVTNSEITIPDLTLYSAWDEDGGLINLSNSNDQLVLLDELDAIVDAVNWGNNFNLNPGLNATVADGQSYERINPFVDTDTAEDWALGPTSTTAALRSTPGVVPVPEPATWAMFGLGACAFGFSKIRRVFRKK